MVELVQEHTPPLVPLDGSAQRIHHLAFLVPDLGAACDQCVARGWPEVLWARTGGLLCRFLCRASARGIDSCAAA